ncbi:hypothetical protein VNO78_10672 [Psophocarpus tetragonolobus]|uniref:Uncharacterized protein n=1 Tax=Psophocarpus tetragonolobus TaxID=3891 RepID=A0AAN9XMF7_PSOTE
MCTTKTLLHKHKAFHTTIFVNALPCCKHSNQSTSTVTSPPNPSPKNSQLTSPNFLRRLSQSVFLQNSTLALSVSKNILEGRRLNTIKNLLHYNEKVIDRNGEEEICNVDVCRGFRVCEEGAKRVFGGVCENVDGRRKKHETCTRWRLGSFLWTMICVSMITSSTLAVVVKHMEMTHKFVTFSTCFVNSIP